MISNKLSLFGQKFKNPNEKLEQFHMDIAASIQKVTEEIVIKFVKTFMRKIKLIIMSCWSVALNCVANGKILATLLSKIWVQPAAGDAGGSLGAALAHWYMILKKKM